MNPDLDLSIERIIRAPRKAVWEAWTDPASLAAVVDTGADVVSRRASGSPPGRRVRDGDER